MRNGCAAPHFVGFGSYTFRAINVRLPSRLVVFCGCCGLKVPSDAAAELMLSSAREKQSVTQLGCKVAAETL